VEQEPERRPRPKRTIESWRTVTEASAALLVLVVVIAVVGVVVHTGRGESAAPPDTLVVAQTQDFASLDPALAQTSEAWELEYQTCAKLYDYPDAAGYRGTRLRPEIAAALPRISPDRLVYRIRVRRGWRFSDGSPVTPQAFTTALARAASAKLVSPASAYLREVASWRADGQTLMIRLRRAAPDFTQRLALPYFCAVPPGTPDTQQDRLPSAGPYAIAHYAPGRWLLLERNPYYDGSRTRRVSRILYRFGAFPSQIALQIDRREIDYGVVNAAAFSSLGTPLNNRHVFVTPQPIVAYLALNTSRPLFRDNPQLRRAVAYAVDRPALVRLFGPRGATSADEYLPPGFPGYERHHLYPLRGPDLAKARALARGHLRGGKAVFLACGSIDCANRALVVADALKQIGLDVRVDTSPGIGQFTLASVRGTKFDIADVITRPDYGDPYGLIDKLLDGRAIRDVGNTNLAYYASPQLNARIDAAQRLAGIARDRAYGRLGLEVARTEAPLVAYAVLNARVLVSARVGCITYQPVYGLDLGGVCLSAQTTG
jgi:peptide/nickel transport system substrate-binding protein